MKKIISSLTLVGMLVMVLGPALAVATDPSPSPTPGSISTNLTRDPGSGTDPIVKAKWEANADRYTDDSTAAGAQFMPSGQYQVGKTIAICAVVTDQDGMADIAGVYADVFYPVDIALGPNHTPLPDQSGLGCGELMQQDKLTKLSKADGIELFCNKVRNLNNNLPTFNTGYNYDEICKQDGELMKETAYVYCAEKILSYEDPSGVYRVLVLAQDNSGRNGVLENPFQYLDLTAFDVDFSSVSYGNVKLNTKKIINGDLTYGTADKPTARNVGNTRLRMKVWQNDMGLGKTDGTWNVKYDGRVGSDATFANYWPESWANLNNPLNLSETDEMDFSIIVTKFPYPPKDNYTGSMILGATKVSHLICQD